MGSAYKIFAKVLSSRLRIVVDKGVGPSQHAFIHGRQILDASLIANGCIDSYLRTNQSGVLCSLILRKFMTMFLGISFWQILRKWAFLASGGVGFSFASLPFGFRF